MNSLHFVRFIPQAALSFLVLAVVGCGPGRGTVSGKVAYQGKPVVWGSVTIIASDHLPYAGQITPEGTYAIPKVPGGPIKLCVTSPNPEGGKREGARGAAGMASPAGRHGGTAAVKLPPKGAWFQLPEKYGDPQQSGLTGTVNQDTTLDLMLK